MCLDITIGRRKDDEGIRRGQEVGGCLDGDFYKPIIVFRLTVVCKANFGGLVKGRGNG